MDGQNTQDWLTQAQTLLGEQGQASVPSSGDWLSKAQEMINASSPTSTGNSWDSFTQTATALAKEHNFPLSVLLGQAALESARGTSNFAKDRNNYFGYMAYDANPGMAKSYQNPSQSIMDYINLIENTPRYAGAYQSYLKDKNPLTLLQGIKSAGYATDPNYVTKIVSMPEFQQNI